MNRLPEEDAALPEHAAAQPSGCRWCGIPKRPHARRWTAAAGWHAWQAPTDAQILARMRARRARRLAARIAACAPHEGTAA
ncbi:hypothetical protein D7231_32065 [Streptomyces klenkii]|uniref:Uncharacterized protein n=1 Tax=Streptomyces klenkii TaxID=1420899 RepID=A0A3B0AMN8_9ACTN|nr:hypothetical protein [Streptomyces klenkii]RKN61908.1 hypothetical protein D7231_32065 [Streptomyces klenkii]